MFSLLNISLACLPLFWKRFSATDRSACGRDANRAFAD